MQVWENSHKFNAYPSVGQEEHSIAEMLWTLRIDNDLRKSMVQEDRKLVETHFSPERQLRILKGLIDGRSATFPMEEHAVLG
jgi:hypothetical protein